MKPALYNECLVLEYRSYPVKGKDSDFDGPVI